MLTDATTATTAAPRWASARCTGTVKRRYGRSTRSTSGSTSAGSPPSWGRRIGQVDAAALPRRPRRCHHRPRVPRRPRAQHPPRQGVDGGAARPHRLRVPGLQPDPDAQRRREHHPADGAGTPEPPTTAPSTVPPPPASLEELIAFVEQDPGRFGEKGTEFLDELQKVQQEAGRKQSDKAAELLDHTQDRVDKGELSPELLSIAEPVLQPIADGPGNSDQGPGDGDGGDEGD